MAGCEGAWLARNATFPVVVESGTYGRALEGCARRNAATSCARVRELGMVVHRPTCRADGLCPGHPTVAVVVLHAGGYERGEACDCFSTEVAGYFAARGALALAVDYRLAGDEGLAPLHWAADYVNRFGNSWRAWPPAMWAAIRDAKEAARHARSDLGADCVVAAGNSAGGTSAVALAVLSDDEAAYRDDLDDWTLSSDAKNASSAVAAAIAFAPTVDGVDAFDDAAERWARGGPPIFTVHNDGDPTNDVANSAYVADAYAGAVELVVLDAHDHAIADTEGALESAVAFLAAQGVWDVADEPTNRRPPAFGGPFDAALCDAASTCGSKSKASADDWLAIALAAAALVAVVAVGVVAGLVAGARRRKRLAAGDASYELAPPTGGRASTRA